MFIYNLSLSKCNLSIVVQSNRLLTYFKLTKLHFMNKKKDVQTLKTRNFIFIPKLFKSQQKHSQQQIPMTNHVTVKTLNVQCMEGPLVYQADVTIRNIIKTYYGLAGSTFKQRYYGHRRNLIHRVLQ